MFEVQTISANRWVGGGPKFEDSAEAGAYARQVCADAAEWRVVRLDNDTVVAVVERSQVICEGCS